MPEESENESGAAGKWFLGKVISLPTTWLGVAVGTAIGLAFSRVSGVVAGICVGTIIGSSVAAVSFLFQRAIVTAHRNATASGKVGPGGRDDARERAVLDLLTESGQPDEGEMLEKMFRDRDAIVVLCHGRADEDAAHTLELVAAIVSESCGQAEELQDLIRRKEDPLLDAPEGVEQMIDGHRGDLIRAYRAVANTRSRLRRGDRLKKFDFLAEPRALSSLSLAALAERLEEETTLCRRIEERLQPDYGKGIAFDEPDSPATERSREAE